MSTETFLLEHLVIPVPKGVLTEQVCVCGLIDMEISSQTISYHATSKCWVIAPKHTLSGKHLYAPIQDTVPRVCVSYVLVMMMIYRLYYKALIMKRVVLLLYLVSCVKDEFLALF